MNTFLKPSTKIEYGLRLMSRIAEAGLGQKKPANNPISLGEISSREKISRKYLEEMANLLKRGGLIDSQRGKQGGYFLTRPAKKINLKQIIIALDGPIQPVICLDGKGFCSLEKSCLSKKAWQKIEISIIKTLEKIILEELIN